MMEHEHQLIRQYNAALSKRIHRALHAQPPSLLPDAIEDVTEELRGTAMRMLARVHQLEDIGDRLRRQSGEPTSADLEVLSVPPWAPETADATEPPPATSSA